MDQKELVIVLDFGGQYSQLIARRIREQKVYCEMLSFSTSIDKLKSMNPKGIVFSGGPNSVYGEKAPLCDPAIFESGIPILGICYGMQLMSHKLGGKVSQAMTKEYGKTMLTVAKDSDPLYKGFPQEIQVWMSHGDFVEEPPAGFDITGSTAHTPVASIANDDKKLYGVQYHPEVVHTPQGKEILKHFLYDVCGCQGTWNMGSFVEQSIKEIRELVGDRKVLCALSGGVDSSVAAVLVHRAIGDQLTCVYVDHGFMRKGETEQIKKTFTEGFHMNVDFVDARARFLNKIAGVTDPESKRKIIGNEFIYLFQDEAKKIGQIDFLVQGTLYPDVVESGTETAAVIKSHHNVGGLPEDMEFELIEPLKWLFKDEVRLVGLELGIPEEIVYRQPFPGPGLAIRILGEITQEKLDILKEADFIVVDEIKKAGLYREIWQSFAVLPDMKSVGVMGDERTYEYAAVVRAVSSDDGMTADWSRMPYELLEKISVRIVNEVKGINRVVYDITSKPPGTIEWE